LGTRKGEKKRKTNREYYEYTKREGEGKALDNLISLSFLGKKKRKKEGSPNPVPWKRKGRKGERMSPNGSLLSQFVYLIGRAGGRKRKERGGGGSLIEERSTLGGKKKRKRSRRDPANFLAFLYPSPARE